MQEWSIDELGFITAGSYFFHVSLLRMVNRIENCGIGIYCDYSNIKFDCSSEEDREKAISFLKTCMINAKEQDRNSAEYYRNYHDAVLATQKSIIGEHMGIVK